MCLKRYVIYISILIFFVSVYPLSHFLIAPLPLPSIHSSNSNSFNNLPPFNNLSSNIRNNRNRINAGLTDKEIVTINRLSEQKRYHELQRDKHSEGSYKYNKHRIKIVQA